MVTRTRAMMVGTLRQRRGPLVIHVESSSLLSSSSIDAWRLGSPSSGNTGDRLCSPPPVREERSSDDVSTSEEDDTRDISPSTSSPDDDDDDNEVDEEDEDQANNAHRNSTSCYDEDVSLLQASSDDEEDDESSLDSNCTGLDRIQYKFQKRGRLLSKVTHGKSRSYHKMILAREVASREQTLRRYKGKNSLLFKCNELPPATPWTPISVYQHLHNEVLFEMHHSMEAAWMAIWYCLGHLSIFMTLDLVRRLVTNRWEISETTVHAFLVVGGFTIVRVNGYLWTWLSQDSYRVVKFDVHNRRILDHWDTRILAWFRQRKTLQDVVSMMGFYMLYLGITYFYERIWIVCEQAIWAGYRYWEAQIVSSLQLPPVLDHDANGLNMTSLSLSSSTTASMVDTCDALLHQTNWSWRGYWFQFWCHQFTSKDIWLVYILFDTVVVVMASLAMAVFGGSLFED